MKLKHYYAAYTPVRVICWIVFKKNEITSGAVYTPCGLSPGKYGTVKCIIFNTECTLFNYKDRLPDPLMLFRKHKINKHMVLFQRDCLDKKVYINFYLWKEYTNGRGFHKEAMFLHGKEIADVFTVFTWEKY